MAKGAISKTEYSTDKFISNIFLVSKKNGKLRPGINLRQLNESVEYHHFKQENLKFVLDLVQIFHYFTSVDLCDAEFQKYLCLSWKNQYYVFRVCLFGLASAPRIFTKLQKSVFTWLRYQGIRCCYYIDDSLCMNQDFDCCQKDTKIITDTLDQLGFTINQEKSVLIPN